MQRRLPILLVLALAACSGGLERSPLDGTWYFNTSGIRSSVRLDVARGAGALLPEAAGAQADALDSIRFDERSGSLEFRRAGSGFYEWYRGRVVEGVFTGRVARSTDAAPPAAAAYTAHATAWSEGHFSRDIAPRVFEIAAQDGSLLRLRIDRDAAADGFSGRLKIYATRSAGAGGEDLEYDVAISRWDGRRLAFSVNAGGVHQDWAGQASGRAISGSFAAAGAAPVSFTGTRAEVLTHGLSAMDPGQRAEWQSRTRAALRELMMAGNPAPKSMAVTVLQADLRPIVPGGDEYPEDRDDDAPSYAPLYHLTELQFDSTLADPQGGPDLSRRAHGYLAIPDSPAPAGGFPVVLAINGHFGSAAALFDPTNELYYYGDAWARRGFAVIAVDVGHRPLADRSALYQDFVAGDDLLANGDHPAIAAAGMDSDFEEDGERVWDMMRALDYVKTRPELNARKIAVTGLSMGGEITSYVGALDPRAGAIVAAGFSPDFGVMLHHGNHPCWQWQHADLREYIDASDLHALAAPKPLLVETGRIDGVYSSLPTPFAADKQVARRSRAAYGADQSAFIHYLHYDAHHYHFGDASSFAALLERDVQVPVDLAPDQADSPAWQTDASTQPKPLTVVDFVRGALGI